MAEKLAQDVAELSGIIKGPSDRLPQASNQNTTSKHVDYLDKQIKDASEAAVSIPQHATPGHRFQSHLRLPQVQLPKFEGKISDDLHRFLEQFTSLIKSSGVSCCFWVTFLKQ